MLFCYARLPAVPWLAQSLEELGQGELFNAAQLSIATNEHDNNPGFATTKRL